MFLNAIPAIGRRHRCLCYVVASESSSWHRSWPATTRLLRKSRASPRPFATTPALCTVSLGCISNFTFARRLRGHTACRYDPVNQMPLIGPLQPRFFGYGPVFHERVVASHTHTDREVVLPFKFIIFAFRGGRTLDRTS